MMEAVSWNLVGLANAHDGADEEYPATARWSWDRADRGHYIELRCGSSWCSFGAPGFVPRHAGRFTQLPPDSAPGWFDEQHLAVDGPDGRLVPGPWARIAPSAEYAVARRAGPSEIAHVFRDGLIAAHMTFEPGPSLAAYEQKFRLGTSQLGTGERRADIRMHWERYWIFWRRHRAWFQNPFGEPPASADVEFMKGQSHAAVGATRWRWVEEDEKAWISCPSNSCCSIAPE
jgi:hypothetical protein